MLQVCNKPVSEVTSFVEAKIRSADPNSKKSIFSGDINVARSAAEALKQQLTRNVELLSSMNALLFPQPGASQPMAFSRCGHTLAKFTICPTSSLAYAFTDLSA
jgi:hypothetical protein